MTPVKQIPVDQLVKLVELVKLIDLADLVKLVKLVDLIFIVCYKAIIRYLTSQITVIALSAVNK